MAENSRSRVTITLGGSGQVVKKRGPSLDSSFDDLKLTQGRKRSVRDRLGGNVDTSAQNNSKRLRADGLSQTSGNGADDMGLGKGDLRFKIMQKNMLKKSQSNRTQSGVDLRDMLSRRAQSSTSSVVPERKDARQRYPEPKDGRLHMSGIRDPRLHTAETSAMSRMRGPRQHMAETSAMSGMREPRQHMAETSIMSGIRDPRQHRAETSDRRQQLPEPGVIRSRMPEPNSLSLLGQRPSTSVPGASSHIFTSGRSYSPWTLEQIRRRSPDVLSTSVCYSPPRREEELPRRPTGRSYDDIRVGSYMNKDIHELTRPLSSASHLTTASLPPGPAKPMAPPLMPPTSVPQRSSYAIDDPPTVESFLRSLGLEKYSILFKAEEVDMYALKQMGDSDLKDLGVPMGPRKKILLALLSRARRQL